jgi:exopolysaccharide biosynthesis operon protein EpsL
MKKPSFRPVLTTVAAACLLPAVLHAQTTLQSTPGQPGQSTAQAAGQSMATSMDTPMGQTMVIPVSPAASISQPFSPVSSDPTGPEGLQFRAKAGVERDDNVLRSSANEISDTITSAGVGLRYNKRFGLQRVVLDAEYERFHFDRINSDFSALNYAAAWYWAFGNRFEGIASADRRQFRDVTSNGLLTAVNRRTERNELFEGGYRLGAAWRVLAGVQHTSARSTDPSSWDSNPEINSVRFGTSYEFASGSSATLRYRHGEGDYQGSPIVTDFDDNELEGVVRWVATAKTSVDARLAYLNREHSGAPSRDFDGLVGSITANWQATPKTGVMVGYARDMGSYLFGTGGHISSDRFFVGPRWRPTEIITVNLRYEHENRRWEDVTGAVADVGRRDKFNVLAAGVDWQIRRTVTLGAQLRNERRESSLPAFNYRANVIGLSAKLTI